MTAAIATTRLFVLRPRLYGPHSLSLPSSRGITSSSASASVAKKKKKNNNEQQQSTKTVKKLALDQHLKKRTRSLADFDRDLYHKYADSPHSSPGGSHVPVMLGEVLQVFLRSPLRSFVDCTLGAAGHSSAIIQTHEELKLYVGLDVDPVAHEKGKARIEGLLKDFDGLKAYTHLRNFKYIKSVLGAIDENLIADGVDGMLMDLGMSSMQVNCSDRGFSVLGGDGPLDMRMNPQASLKAEDILNSWPDDEVGRILRDYGEESNWHSLQRTIVNARANGGLHSTGELVKLIRGASYGYGGRHGWIKTATRVFQALRIAVNDELQTLEGAIYACFDSLSPGGRLAVISFHSLEDRIVKQTFLDVIGKEGEGDNCEGGTGLKEDEAGADGEIWSKRRVEGRYGAILTKRPVTPSEEEEKVNRRCRSAKLRVVQKGLKIKQQDLGDR